VTARRAPRHRRLARGHGATPLIVVPQFGPEESCRGGAQAQGSRRMGFRTCSWWSIPTGGLRGTGIRTHEPPA
jgi:hypothetical protein